MRTIKSFPFAVTALFLSFVCFLSPALAIGPPRISRITVRPNRALIPGDTLNVIITGSDGGTARFEISWNFGQPDNARDLIRRLRR